MFIWKVNNATDHRLQRWLLELAQRVKSSPSTARHSTAHPHKIHSSPPSPSSSTEYDLGERSRIPSGFDQRNSCRDRQEQEQMVPYLVDSSLHKESTRGRETGPWYTCELCSSISRGKNECTNVTFGLRRLERRISITDLMLVTIYAWISVNCLACVIELIGRRRHALLRLVHRSISWRWFLAWEVASKRTEVSLYLMCKDRAGEQPQLLEKKPDSHTLPPKLDSSNFAIWLWS